MPCEQKTQLVPTLAVFVSNLRRIDEALQGVITRRQNVTTKIGGPTLVIICDLHSMDGPTMLDATLLEII